MDNTAYIDDYLQGRLNDQDKSAFENRLKEDPIFASEYDTQLSAQALITTVGVFQTKETLRQYEEKKYGKSRARVNIWIWAAAAILLITILMWFLFAPKNTNSNQQLFAEFFTRYRDPVAVRGNEGPDDIRTKANEAYRSGDFASAKLYYSQITSFTPADRFYYGLSALQSSDDQLAISLLKEMAESKTDYEQQAHWYLALAYLKNNSRNNVLKELTRIVNEKGFKYKEAQELLDKFD